MTFSRLMPTRAVSKYALCFLLGLVSFQLYAQTSGLHIGAYHEDPTTNPEDPTPGLLYLNLPAGDQSFKGLMDFTFVGCQSKSVGEIKGEKINGALKGEWSGQVDYTFQTGSYNGRYIAKDKYYTGTYVVNKGKQFVKVPNCIEYYIAPHGTWSIFELNHTFSESKPFEPISVVDGVAKWSMPPGTTIASISLVDKELAVSGAKNAVLHQLIIPASLKNYRLPAQYAKSGKTYVISVIASNGRKVVYFSSIEFPEKSNGKLIGGDIPVTIKGGSAKDVNNDDVEQTPTVSIPLQPDQLKSAKSKPVAVRPPKVSSGSQVPKPKISDDNDNNNCDGVYEGHLDGAVQGKFRLNIGNIGRSFEARSVSDAPMQPGYSFAGGSNIQCDIDMYGVWQGSTHVEGFKSQTLWLTGLAGGGEINGRYRFDRNSSSPMMGSFYMVKINKGFYEK
jgi:hypothetical protein